MQYVVGVVFTLDLRNVLLIRKNRPAWAAGRLNGPGGKVEQGEGHLAAMVREFREETGLTIPPEKWQHVAHQVVVPAGDIGHIVDAALAESYAATVDYYSAATDEAFTATSPTDEEVGLYSLDAIAEAPMADHLRWIIPLCLARTVVTPLAFMAR